MKIEYKCTRINRYTIHWERVGKLNNGVNEWKHVVSDL